MKHIFQKTLSQSVSFKGVGLHSGKNVKINVIPAKDNEGIVFKRIDLAKNNLIKRSDLFFHHRKNPGSQRYNLRYKTQALKKQ